ncbi:PLP-dependent aspartate aminotransferase family protein [Ruegeria sp. R14_0]|uniref:trans-sulfuration enzyme family protein n=1 Tax=Ruegeria sp. R14_0 TaxID=2821100 RepID=UPI001ADA2AD7|nr:PLP-dependent aspartate aminotransferase family protein [Ruegeria sp. R14_0]MBO9445701.1 PLP-dependent transferase [Ruegeria sp. R14_0]
MGKELKNAGLATKAIHAGEGPDPVSGASAPALQMSSTFVTDQVAGFSAHDLEEEAPYLYGRWANPNVRALETKISVMEGTEDCVCLASGMAAATAIFLTFLSAGDHVIVSDVSYAGVAELARDTLPRMGIEVTTVDMSDLPAVSAAIRSNTRLIHTETPVNPIGRLSDLKAISEIARNAGALLSCDATFASPLGQSSRELGVDLIMHSVTKYIGGHGDAIGGAVAGRRELIEKMRNESAIHHGSIMSPFNAWIIARGMATLPLRMKAHEAGATAVAQWLETREAVTKVIYPGLKSHPQYELAQRQMKNMSGMITFQVGDRATGEAFAQQMIDKLKIIHYAVSLGHHRSLIFWMGTDALMETSFRLEGENMQSYRDYAGEGVFRLSIGLEDPEDLIADLAQII